MTTWHHELTDSVNALGAATRELHAAHSHSRHAVWSADPGRIAPATGLLAIPGAEPVHPHDEALWLLNDLYTVLEHHTHELYENAALGYAYGTAAALTAVLRNEHPRHVELPRDAHGRYVYPAQGLPDLDHSLTTRVGGRELDRLRTRFVDCLDVHDTESSDEQADALATFTTDLADAAFAYAEHAERVLHHLLEFADAHGFLQAG